MSYTYTLQSYSIIIVIYIFLNKKIIYKKKIYIYSWGYLNETFFGIDNYYMGDIIKFCSKIPSSKMFKKLQWFMLKIVQSGFVEDIQCNN